MLGIRRSIHFGCAAIIFFSVLLCACSKEKQEIIPERTMIQILKDIYLATGLLESYDISRNYSSKDSISVYFELYEKYGYSRETIENNIRYYFIKENRKLAKMYNSIISDMMTEKTILQNTIDMFSSEAGSFWPRDEKTFILIGEKKDESVSFEKQIVNKGIYTIKYDIIVNPWDKTVDPYVEIWSANVIDEGTGIDSVIIAKKRYVKDGIKHSYSISYEKNDEVIIRLYGVLFGSDGDPSVLKNAIISNVRIDHTTRFVENEDKDIIIDNRSLGRIKDKTDESENRSRLERLKNGIQRQ